VHGDAHPLTKELAERALEASGTAILISGPSLAVTYVNRAFLSMWGFERAEQVLGRPATDFWADEVAAADVAREIAWSGSWSGELVARRADGVEFTARVAANLFRPSPDTEPRLVATFVDVTELRLAEEALVRAQRIGQIGSWSLDTATGAVAWSAEVNRIFGIPEDEPPSVKGFFDRIHPADQPRVRDAMAPETAKGGGITYRVARADGERVVNGVAQVVATRPGQPPRLEGTVQDITDRVRLEEQLRQSQKMEAVGLLAGGIAHDFNNLLTVILSGAEFLQDGLAPGDPRRADAEQILGAARRAEVLTRQLLAFSRRQVQRPIRLDVGGIVHGVTKLLQRVIGEDVAVVLELAEALPPVHVDGVLLEQALMNLVVNARDAMPGGGRLAISTALRDLEGAEAARLELPPGRYVVLTVADTGRGMDEATRARIFEPFFTTKERGRGSGLGLSTVYGIARQAGGVVDVRSRPGEGAAFSVYFPASEGAEPADGGAGSPATNEAPRVHTILIAEDEAAVRAVAERCLVQRGYRVRTAADGEEALRIAGELHHLDLLLTDVVMPGINGRQLAERLKSIHPYAPVLFMTGYTDDMALRLGIETNQVRILSKPFTPDGLAAAVAEAMARPGESAAARDERVKTSG